MHKKPIVWLDGKHLPWKYKMDCIGMIYCITNLKTGHKYIGQTENIEKRIYSHRNKYLASDAYPYIEMRKFDWFDLEFTTLEKIYDKENLANTLDQLETKWIKFYNTLDRNVGYNTFSGGKKDFIRPKFLVDSVTEKRKQGFKLGKYSAPNKGIPMDEATKLKSSITKKAQYKSGEVVAWAKGKAIVQETKDKIAEAHGGRSQIHSDNYDPAKGHIKRGSHLSKATEFKSSRVMCVETGEIFNTITSAAKFIKISSSGFSRFWKYPEKDQTAGGFHWRKLTLEENKLLDEKEPI